MATLLKRSMKFSLRTFPQGKLKICRGLIVNFNKIFEKINKTLPENLGSRLTHSYLFYEANINLISKPDTGISRKKLPMSFKNTESSKIQFVIHRRKAEKKAMTISIIQIQHLTK